MSSMFEKTTDLTLSGPLVAVKIWGPKRFKSVCTPIDTLAEINTGIAHTFVQEGVATSLGLEPVGRMKIRTSSSLAFESYLFRIRVVFPEGNMAFEVNAVEVPYMLRPKARVKCLIGRDILRYTILMYSGPANMFSLQFQGKFIG